MYSIEPSAPPMPIHQIQQQPYLAQPNYVYTQAPSQVYYITTQRQSNNNSCLYGFLAGLLCCISTDVLD